MFFFLLHPNKPFGSIHPVDYWLELIHQPSVSIDIQVIAESSSCKSNAKIGEMPCRRYLFMQLEFRLSLAFSLQVCEPGTVTLALMEGGGGVESPPTLRFFEDAVFMP